MSTENTKTFIHTGVNNVRAPLIEPQDTKEEAETASTNSKAGVDERSLSTP